MNREILRAYDIRGLVGEDLTDNVVTDIGRAMATHMVERGKRNATIGRDCRLSSGHFRDLLHRQLQLRHRLGGSAFVRDNSLPNVEHHLVTQFFEG